MAPMRSIAQQQKAEQSALQCSKSEDENAKLVLHAVKSIGSNSFLKRQ